jgi:hypothetical protein
MWNVLKFFFVWFWLGLAATVFSLYVIGSAHPHATASLQRHHPQSASGWEMLLFLGLPFLMSVPSYFIARPKRVY